MAKTLVLGPTLVQSQIFFFKNLAPSVTRYYGQLSSCTTSEKTDDPVLRKRSDGQTDRQMNQSDFIGRCPTNVERPTRTLHWQKQILKFMQKARIWIMLLFLKMFILGFQEKKNLKWSRSIMFLWLQSTMVNFFAICFFFIDNRYGFNLHAKLFFRTLR